MLANRLVRAHRPADARVRRWGWQSLGARTQITRCGDIVIGQLDRPRAVWAAIVAARWIGAALWLRLATTAPLVGAALWLRLATTAPLVGAALWLRLATTRLRRLTDALRLLWLWLWLAPAWLLVAALPATAPSPPALVPFTRWLHR
jgi:hypothetical protein